MKGDPVTYAAIMKLKPGQMTDIIPLLDPTTRKPVGYSIYKLISKEPAGQREINDPRVQQAIRQQLRDGRSQLLKNAFFEMLARPGESGELPRRFRSSRTSRSSQFGNYLFFSELRV